MAKEAQKSLNNKARMGLPLAHAYNNILAVAAPLFELSFPDTFEHLREAVSPCTEAGKYSFTRAAEILWRALFSTKKREIKEGFKV